jgi:hypothetical protein
MKNFTTLFALLFVSVIAFGQRTTGLNSTGASSVNQASAAKAFGLSVVKSYFESNCPSVYEKLASTVTDVAPQFLSPSTVTSTPKDVIRKTDFCANTPLKDKTTPYTSYTANYEPIVMDHNQFRTNYPRQQMLLNLTSGDFFFDGANLKAGGVNLFNNPSALQFVVRKNSRGVFEITKITLP